MKNRVLTFLIGLLAGSIVTIIVFLLVFKSVDNKDIGNIPQNGNGEMFNPGGMGEPPEKPEGEMPTGMPNR